MTIVLASASPRRQELLAKAGIEFVVRPANIPEVQLPDESPKGFAERMAQEKARAIRDNLETADKEDPTSPKPSETAQPRNKNSFAILGADTVVVIGNEVLGKPANSGDAARMLRVLSGREHSVITGVCLSGENFEDVRSEITIVYFGELSESDIESYIKTGEPMDKAGAYAIQGVASRWISKIEGDYNNVVGLPVDLVLQMLREHGVS
jgi:septum formation protein